MIYIAMILIVALVIFTITSAIYLRNGWFKIFYHDILGWHQPDNSPKWSDDCSDHCICKHCGKEIMQDSQGNWF